MIRFHITKPAQEFYFSDTGPEPQIAFSFPDHFLKIGVLDGLTSPSPLAQIRKSEFLIGPFTLYTTVGGKSGANYLTFYTLLFRSNRIKSPHDNNMYT